MSVKSASIEELNARRRRGVELRLGGSTWLSISQETGLSVPTLISAFKSFTEGGWPAVPVGRRGRRVGQGRLLRGEHDAELRNIIASDLPHQHGLSGAVWSSQAVTMLLQQHWQVSLAPRTLSRLLSRLGLSVRALSAAPADDVQMRNWLDNEWPVIRREVRRTEANLYWCSLRILLAPEGERLVLAAATLRGQVFWHPALDAPMTDAWPAFLDLLPRSRLGRIAVLLHGMDVTHAPALRRGIEERAHRLFVWPCPINLWAPCPVERPLPSTDERKTAVPAQALAPSPAIERGAVSTKPGAPASMTAPTVWSRANPSATQSPKDPPVNLTHLQRLEAESIHIIREVVAECEKPVMLYSIGKDSSVMLHLARKAFYPAVPPFPLLHVDTTWKFRDMYEMRERMARESGMDLIVYVNRQGLEMGVNPFSHGSQIHTDVMKTQALKQALDKYGFDAAFGGARRDEEKSRAKERVFSFRSAAHRWDPKNQRPELWRLYNARKHKGESLRVFPLSNWTELDVWQYIWLNNIPVVPLYFAKPRPVVERDGMLIMVDDNRMPLKPGEVPMMRKVRFRTLGCYPLSGAVESEAGQLTDVIQEMLLTRTSERQGRLIDHDQAASMEKKKQEGYF
jgi:sulfate adenylyltransferase subunit 2